MKRLGVMITCGIFLAGCATTSPKLVETEAPVAQAQQVEAQKQAAAPDAKRYKRKIGISRFSNETTYGRALFSESEASRLGKQASDMLASRLVKSGKFLVFERPDQERIALEAGKEKMVGVDTLIIGSVTEFGRSVGGKVGFLSSTKVQTARAKVDIRLVDPRTGLVFFSGTGAGEASTESGEIAGYGSKAAYDATLNDRAIAAAISDVIDRLVSSLDERPWRTDVLQVEAGRVYISGGKTQGLKKGDTLRVLETGKTIKSGQSGFDITLPPKELTVIKVTGFFGEGETAEGALCDVVKGSIESRDLAGLFVQEVKQ